MKGVVISYFNHVRDNIPKDYDLEEWLKMTINPPKNFEDEVNSYRDTLDKKTKEKLPCVTISASFDNVRNLDNIRTRNHFICFDIDRYAKAKKDKSNRCVDMLLVKEMFMDIPSTLYTGFSVSGDGVYGIIRIKDPERFSEYFEFFQQRFAHIGINIDNSCKDLTRLRFFSVDKEAYYNPDAKAFVLPPAVVIEPVKAPDPIKTVKPQMNQTAARQIYENSEKVKKIIANIQKHSIDITASYDDWFKIGGALYSEFGEDGRGYFHAISQYHPDYKATTCDEKYNQCKKLKSISFGTMLTIAASYGIKYMDR